MDTQTIVNQINKWIAEVESDERLSYPPANAQVNAPLALAQVALENRLYMLKHMLDFIERGNNT